MLDIAILVGLIFLNGLFAMSEIAIVTARKARMNLLAQSGNRSAKVALHLAEDPTDFLSAVQIGITSIGLLNGIYGESVLADPLAIWLQQFGVSSSGSALLATVIVVVVVTYLSIVIGELVPKRMGQIHAERIACLVAYPMLWLSKITHPFVWLLSASTALGLRLLRIKSEQTTAITEEEIQALLHEGSEAGVIEDQEHAMLRNVFRLDDRPLASMMVPRSDICFIDLALPQEVNLARIVKSHHSYFPVCEDSLSNVVGVLHAHHLLQSYIQQQEPDLRTLVQDVILLPETLSGLEVLNHFRASRDPVALVVDEYGELQGLITEHDLLAILTGEFSHLPIDEQKQYQRADGSWLLDGLIALPELKDCLGINQLPEEDKHHYHTLSGLIMYLLGHIPKTGTQVTLGAWQFEVVDMDGHRIDKVWASRKN